MIHVAEYLRLMLYPMLALALFNTFALMRRGVFMFTCLILWVMALAAVNISLLVRPEWSDELRAYATTPLLALSVLAIWRQLWISSRER